MSVTYFERTVKKSSKPYQCSWCIEQIEQGQPYSFYGWRDGKETGVERMHPECFAAMREMESIEGGWFFWIVGDFHRGCCCANGDCKCVKVEVSE